MNDFIICTFYTPSYEQYLDAWADSLQPFGYEFTARPLPDRGKWNLNDCMKPRFIRDMMIEHPDKNIVWVDIDAVFVKKPELFETINADMAGYLSVPMPSEKRSIDRKYRYKNLWRGRFVLGGTLYFANSVNALTLINLWIESVENDPHRFVGEQDNLNEVLDKHADRIGLDFYELPIEYAYCEPHSENKNYAGYGRIDDAVILHDFASREARRMDKGLGRSWESRLNIKRKLSVS